MAIVSALAVAGIVTVRERSASVQAVQTREASESELARVSSVGDVRAARSGETSALPQPASARSVRVDDSVAFAGREAPAAGQPELSRLIQSDLETLPDSAAETIHALARAGRSGSASDRVQAARTLGRWLTEENQKAGAHAAANVVNLVEALGEVGGSDARQHLVQALNTNTLDISVETLAVQQLGKAESADERTAIERVLRRLEATPAAEGIDGELRAEGIHAAREALKG
jgi:hypothetical protein